MNPNKLNSKEPGPVEPPSIGPPGKPKVDEANTATAGQQKPADSRRRFLGSAKFYFELAAAVLTVATAIVGILLYFNPFSANESIDQQPNQEVNVRHDANQAAEANSAKPNVSAVNTRSRSNIDQAKVKLTTSSGTVVKQFSGDMMFRGRYPLKSGYVYWKGEISEKPTIEVLVTKDGFEPGRVSARYSAEQETFEQLKTVDSE